MVSVGLGFSSKSKRLQLSSGDEAHTGALFGGEWPMLKFNFQGGSEAHHRIQPFGCLFYSCLPACASNATPSIIQSVPVVQIFPADFLVLFVFVFILNFIGYALSSCVLL